jgi:hypothetical protein
MDEESFRDQEGEDMTVSLTLRYLAEWGMSGAPWLYFLEVCDKQGFDLDDFMFEIWKATLHD